LGFTALFIFRIIYGYTSKSNNYDSSYIENFFVDRDVKRNYASSKYNISRGDRSSAKSNDNASASTETTVESGQALDVNQKYEKTAEIRSKSSQFAKDKQSAETRIKSQNAIVQFEQRNGNQGNREWHISVGVQPQMFDTMQAFFSKLGSVKFAEITKTDKTSEFKNLNAKKNSLEKTRNALLELKGHTGKIDEFVNLSNRILEIESELQGLGVLLGEFSEENEFCTVKFSLIESRPLIPISLLHRLKVAFEWTTMYYLMFVTVILCASAAAFFILLLIEKLQGLGKIIKKMNDK
jgi:hypothetical protein